MRILISKLLVLCFLVFVGLAAAGIYGAMHNQISYTVSPAYFTKFKFQQFGLTDASVPERVRASIVGFLASWWMGFPIGLLIGLVGFIHRGASAMLRVSLKAMLVAVGFTLLFGICGLVYGFAETSTINIGDYQNWSVPSDIANMRNFLCAGYMHNSAYLERFRYHYTG